MSLKCIKCGKELKEGAKFCTSCGTKVEIQQAENIEQPVEQPKSRNITIDVDATVEKLNSSVTKGTSKLKDLFKNKIAVIALIAVVAFGVLVTGVNTISSSPKSSMKGFCKSMSRLDFEKAFSKYTTANSSINMAGELLGELGSEYGVDTSKLSSKNVINMITKEMKKEFLARNKSMDLSIVDMTKVYKDSKLAQYKVAVLMKVVDKDGDIDTHSETFDINFEKDGLKWKIDITSLDDLM